MACSIAVEYIIYSKFSRTCMLHIQYLRAGPMVFDGCYNRRSMKEMVCTCSWNQNLGKVADVSIFTSILHTYIDNLSRMAVKPRKASGVLWHAEIATLQLRLSWNVTVLGWFGCLPPSILCILTFIKGEYEIIDFNCSWE